MTEPSKAAVSLANEMLADFDEPRVVLARYIDEIDQAVRKAAAVPDNHADRLRIREILEPLFLPEELSLLEQAHKLRWPTVPDDHRREQCAKLEAALAEIGAKIVEDKS